MFTALYARPRTSTRDGVTRGDQKRLKTDGRFIAVVCANAARYPVVLVLSLRHLAPGGRRAPRPRASSICRISCRSAAGAGATQRIKVKLPGRASRIKIRPLRHAATGSGDTSDGNAVDQAIAGAHWSPRLRREASSIDRCEQS